MPETRTLPPAPGARFSAEQTDPSISAEQSDASSGSNAWIPVAGFAPTRTESLAITIHISTPYTLGRFTAGQLRALEAASKDIPDPVTEDDEDL
jgi:hypothetical protein